MNRPILITGGTGFLGQALVRNLARAGRSVHVLCRATSDRSVLDDVEVEWHTGDLTNPSSVHAAVRAVTQACGAFGSWDSPGMKPRADVVHAGAVISYRRADRGLQHQVNVEGTRTVLAAARRYGIARVVHVSSVVAIGHAVRGEALDESAPFNGAHLRVDYVTTKREAEEVALGFNGEVEVVVVNPGAIFGRGEDSSNTERFMRSIWRRDGFPLAPPGGMSVVGVEDVAEGIRLALDKGRPGERYILAESFLPALDLFQKVARAFDVPSVRAAVPRRLWPAIVAGGRLADRVLSPKLATPQALTLLGLHFRFSAERARTELGWQPQAFDRVLWETVQHMRAVEA